MNIFFVDYYSERNNNGLNTYTTQLVSSLNKNGVKVNMIWVNSSLYRVTTKIQIDSISHLHIPRPNQEKQVQYDEIVAAAIDIAMRDMAGLILHLNWINHCGIAWHLKQKRSIKVILTKHCLPWRDLIIKDYTTFYELNSAYEKGISIPIKHPQLKKEILGYDNVDHIIAVTKSAQFSLTKLFNIDNHKISVIYNGIDPEGFNSEASVSEKRELKAKYGFNPDEKVIFYAGKITLSKGIIDVAHIFDSVCHQTAFKNTRLVIAGEGHHHLIFEKVKKFWSRITITGNLDKQTLYDFYAMADVGIVPSFTEQCSYTCIEMMFNNLPLIVSDIDGLRELIDVSRGVKIKVDFRESGASINKNNLRRKLTFLLANEEEAQRLAANSRSYAQQHLTAKRMVNETIGVYQKMLTQKVEYNPSDKKIFPLPKVSGPLVTIIMPCYNVDKYLKHSLSSIFSQTYTHFELVVINDGSNDATEEIIKKVNDPRLIYLKNNVNKGITFSLNRAVKKSSGKYIIRMDADDIMRMNRIEKQIGFLESNSDYGMVGSSYTIIDDHGMPINIVNHDSSNQNIELDMLFFNPFAHPTVALRSDVIKDLLYDKKYNHCEDYELWFRVAEKYKVGNLPENLLEYRTHGSNVTKKYAARMKQNVIKLLSRELNKLGIDHDTEELIMHSAVNFGYASQYFNSPEKKTKLINWLNKVLASPSLVEKHSEQRLAQFKLGLLKNCGL